MAIFILLRKGLKHKVKQPVQVTKVKRGVAAGSQMQTVTGNITHTISEPQVHGQLELCNTICREAFSLKSQCFLARRTSGITDHETQRPPWSRLASHVVHAARHCPFVGLCLNLTVMGNGTQFLVLKTEIIIGIPLGNLT